MVYYALEEKLRSLGFRHDQEAPILCRWRVAGVFVDLMPLREDTMLGFSNPWYSEGFAQAIA